MLGWGESCSLMERVFVGEFLLFKRNSNCPRQKIPALFSSKKKMPSQGRWKWCLPEQSKTELTKRNGQVGLLFILSWNLFLCRGNVIHVSRAESPLWKRRVRRIKYLVLRLQILVRRPGWNGHTGGRKGYIQKAFVDCFVSFRGISFPTQKNVAATRRFSRGYFGGTFYSFGGIFGSS